MSGILRRVFRNSKNRIGKEVAFTPLLRITRGYYFRFYLLNVSYNWNTEAKKLVALYESLLGEDKEGEGQ